MRTPVILTTVPTTHYALLDSGDGEKLERYGSAVVSRPDPQALWKKRLPASEWKKADAVFTREREGAGWRMKKGIPNRWPIELGGLKFWIRPTSFKHTGIFPEHVSNWGWVAEEIKKKRNKETDGQIYVLNLFGYTGGATLAAAKAGAIVCHVDGSKVAVNWARGNAELSGLKNRPIRWIVDDARAFVKREITRGRRYDGIIMDPPAFGHGPKKELWKIEKDFLPLLDLCREVMADKPLFFLLNGYASGYSPIAYENNLKGLFGNTGNIEMGELTIEEKDGGRLLPCGIFARWSRV